MTYAFMSKFSKVILQHDPNLIAMVLKTDIINKKRSFLKKGMVLNNFSNVTISDQNGTDFMENLISAHVTCDAFRIPRFLKNYLLKSTSSDNKR